MGLKLVNANLINVRHIAAVPSFNHLLGRQQLPVLELKEYRRNLSSDDPDT